MSIFYGKSGSVYNFYDTDIGNVPDGSIGVSYDLYKKLLSARSRGAILSVSGDSIIAKAHDGTLINLESMTGTETYFSPVPLREQATTVLATARTYVYNNYGILNEDTPTVWVTYLKALMAIINGTDTTSTALPSAPTS